MEIARCAGGGEGGEGGKGGEGGEGGKGGGADAVRNKPQSSYRIVYYQGVSLDALRNRNRAAKRVATEDGGWAAPAAKVARGARPGEAEAEASSAEGPVVADWLDCVPEVPYEEEEAAAAAAAAKAAVHPVH